MAETKIEKSEAVDKERTEAIDALVRAYIREQRLEDALKAVYHGASSQTKHILLKNIFAAENPEIGGLVSKVKMAIEVASLGMSQAAIQDFVNQILEKNWFESAVIRPIFIESKNNMLETVKPLIENVIKVYVKNGCFLSAKGAVKLLNRELSVDEINTIIKKHCEDGNIDDVLDIIRETGARELTIKEINMLTEGV